MSVAENALKYIKRNERIIEKVCPYKAVELPLNHISFWAMTKYNIFMFYNVKFGVKVELNYKEAKS